MSKSAMLRTRRRDVNIKPNRRLDRKSSRGMIYENEELRLRTININAEIERGQSDIKKLRRENEQLRKEIWCLRDEYEKLDKLLQEKEHEETSCSSCTSDSESCTSATESSENESTQNMENVQKTTMHSLRTEFDHLSVVTEETSADCSDKNSNPANSVPKDNIDNPQQAWNILPPDQSYPNCPTLTMGTASLALLPPQPPDPSPQPKHFFSPLHRNVYDGFGDYVNGGSWGVIPRVNGVDFGHSVNDFGPNIGSAGYMCNVEGDVGNLVQNAGNMGQGVDNLKLQPCEKTSSDLIVKTDTGFVNFSQESQGSTNSFANGGNLEELLQDIHTISNDILQISGDLSATKSKEDIPGTEDEQNRPYKTELNVVLMPKPMPLLGFEKYEDLKTSMENIKKSSENLIRENEPIAELNESYFSFPRDVGFNTMSAPVLESADLTRVPSNPFFYVENFQNLEKCDGYGFKNECIENSNKLNEMEEKYNDNAINTNTEEMEKITPKADKEKNDDKEDKSPKMRKTKKVSIYFKGKKDKLARSLSLDTKVVKNTDSPKITPSPVLEKKLETMAIQKTDSKTSIFDPNTSKDEKTQNSDAKTSTDSKNSYDRKHRKSSSTSPERKHHHPKHEDSKKGHKRRHKKVERRPTLKRNSLSLDRQRDRSFSVCTDRSHILDHRFGHFEEFTNSERERTNSLSSCDTVKSRKNSGVPSFQVTGKIPWFGCWGNGCI